MVAVGVGVGVFVLVGVGVGVSVLVGVGVGVGVLVGVGVGVGVVSLFTIISNSQFGVGVGVGVLVAVGVGVGVLVAVGVGVGVLVGVGVGVDVGTINVSSIEHCSLNNMIDVVLSGIVTFTPNDKEENETFVAGFPEFVNVTILLTFIVS